MCTLSAPACRPAATDPQQTPVLRIGFGVGATAKASAVANLIELLYSEPLIGRQVDGRPAPHLAEAWSWENQDRRVRVRLKRGVRLHSGELLTPQIVAGSLNQQVEHERRTDRDAFDTVKAITAEGDSVVVELLRPDALLLSELLGRRITHPDSHDNGTGPFRIVNRAPVAETLRFEQYHGGPSELAGVTIVTYESQRSAWSALMRREVDAVQEVGREAVEFFEGSETARTYSFLQPFYIPLVFNMNHPALRAVEVRRAITEGLNRVAIVEEGMHGLGQVADGPIWPLHWAFSAPAERYTFAPARAMKRLEDAGFPLRQASGREPRSRFSFKCLFWSEDPQYERIALMIQRHLFDIGVNMILEPATLASLSSRVSVGDFDSFLIRTNASRALDLSYRFWRSTGVEDVAMQRSGYTGADGLLDELRESTSDEAVRRAVAALSQRFHQDAPAAFIAWTEITRAVDSRFAVPDAGSEDPFANIWQWRPVERDAGR